MKKKIFKHIQYNSLIIIILFCFSCTFEKPISKPNSSANQHILVSLKELVFQKESYTQEKENNIKEIQKLLETPHISQEQQYTIHRQLFDAFKTFISDSAIYYVKKNIEISKSLQKEDWYNESQLDLASLYSISGNYLDAFSILQSLQKKNLTKEARIRYFSGFELLFNNYSFNNPNAELYKHKANQYRDSILQLLDVQSTHYQIVKSDLLSEKHQYSEAKNVLQNKITLLPDNHEKAVLTYMLATIYKKEKNTAKAIEYFAISASCDIKNAIKENASMLELATALFELGDVENAYLFIKSSMEDAIFCNAKLRSGEAMKLFPIIEASYKEKMQQQNHRLWLSLTSVGLISVLLIMAILYVYWQMKRIAKIRKELYHKSLELEKLNQNLQEVIKELNQSNTQLSQLNIELSESDRVKEVYIAQFFNLCSVYIDKLEKFQHALAKKAKDRNTDELIKMLRSTEMIDKELKELYRLFDEIFLHLYPHFVSEFNQLLVPEERFNLNSNELNPELRIFALIRLGITDSSQIASFLHYATNTIYTYRTKVRNKSLVPRDQFENFVMKIGKNKD